MTHPALVPGSVAVITGGAAGIGLAAAKRFARLGLHVSIADLGAERLGHAAEEIAALTAAGARDVLTVETDVSRVDDVRRLEAAVRDRFGGTDVLMNNAGIQPGSDILGPAENWQRVLAVNLWGIIHGTQTFLPAMLERGRPGLIINTGSKQGITTPPGDPAYNVAKAGVKAFTEALQHELRNRPDGRLSAHLLIPGFVFTGLTAKGRAEKPAAAWTPGADRRLHARAPGGRRLLHPLPRQRRPALARRAPHPLGRRRHRREPPAAVALAPGLRQGLRGLQPEPLGPFAGSVDHALDLNTLVLHGVDYDERRTRDDQLT